MKDRTHFRDLLEEGRLLEIPSVFDAMTTGLAEEAGFDGVFFGGGVTSNFNFGLPDMGIVSLTERLDHVRRSTAPFNISPIVDIDQGGGSRVAIRRTVAYAEAAGVHGLMVDDLLSNKEQGMLSIDDGAAVIRAVAEARTDPRTVIVAHTYAYFLEGIDSVVARADRYAAEGADLLMVVGAPESELMSVSSRTSATLAWTIDSNPTPELRKSLFDHNVRFALYYPHATVAAYHGVKTVFQQLKAGELPDVGNRHLAQRPLLDTIKFSEWEKFSAGEDGIDFKAVAGRLLSVAAEDA